MKVRYIYMVLLLMSNAWLADADYNLKNLKGSAEISLLSSDIYNTSLRVEVSDYMLLNLDESSNKFKVFIDDGSSIMDLGSPDLPKLSTSIIIPDNMKMNVVVTDAEYQDYSNVYIAPSKGNLTRDIDPSSIPFTYNDSYKKNDFYPGSLAELDSPYILRDLRGQSVIFYPIQYNPATKTLRVYSKIDIDIISTNELSNDNILSRNLNSVKIDNEFMYIYNDLFINSDNDTRFESGVNLREDEKQYLNQSLPTSSKDLIGFINLKSKITNGWKKDIIYKKRIKTIDNELEDFNYSLSRIFLSYRELHHPVNWEITAKTEESFLDQRAVVYDSIGLGLGQYRYDKTFNTYIPDPNGSYVAYTVNTGDRIQTSVVDARHKITVDFNKLSGYLPLLLRSNSRIDYRGDRKEFEKIFKPDIDDLSISKLILDTRFEILYSGNHRLLGWLDIRRRLDGLDPRGNNLNNETAFGIEYDKALTKHSALRLKNNFHIKHIESNISSLRNRSLNGWWSEVQYLYKINNGLDIDMSLIYGNDYGEQQESNFNVSAYGVKLDGRYFLHKKGRLQTGISFINVIEETSQGYIPPESVNGNPLGIGIRSNTRFQYFINQSISLIVSLNTIDDQRFDNFLTFEGEVRAHF